MSDEEQTQVMDLFEVYKKARMERELKEAEATQASKVLTAVTMKLVEAMGALRPRLKQIATDDGISLHLKRHVGVSCTEENREETRQWLIETTGDDEPFVEEVISKKALTEFIGNEAKRKELDEDDFPSFLKVNLHPGVSVLGWKQFKTKRGTESK